MLIYKRYLSLDVFRGTTVALMILVNNPGTWAYIYEPFRHADWHGLTPTDLVFPFFLFAVGNAMAFVIPRLRAEGDAAFWRKVITRSLLIFLIGSFLSWFPFAHWLNDELVLLGWEWTTTNGEIRGIRVLGTLQRIAICYFFASILVYYVKVRTAAIFGGVVLLLYWIITYLMNPDDPYSFDGWFGKAIDLNIFGEAHVYRGDNIPFENEGLISTIPAIIQVVFGFVVGDYIKRRGKETANIIDNKGVYPIFQTLTILFIAAALLIFVGYVWSLDFPINKKIQSSSFVIVTTGLAISVLAILAYYIEIKNYRGWLTRFFDVFGKNALFIYALSELLPKLSQLVRIPQEIGEEGEIIFVGPLAWFYYNVAIHIPGPIENGSLFYSICIVIFYWGIGYWMDKNKIYIKV